MHVQDGSLRRIVHERDLQLASFVGTEESPMHVSAFLKFWPMARGGTLFAKHILSFDQGLRSRSQALT